MPEIIYQTHMHCSGCGKDFGYQKAAASKHVEVCSAEPFPAVVGDTVWTLYRGDQPAVRKIGRVLRLDQQDVVVERSDRGFRKENLPKKYFGNTYFIDQAAASNALHNYKQSEKYRQSLIKQEHLMDTKILD